MSNYTRTVMAIFFLFSTSPVASQYCGDNICESGERCYMDCEDMHCGDYICSPELGENRYTCTQDCVCGDGVCSYGEDSSYCSVDCGPPPPPPTPCITDQCSTCSRVGSWIDTEGDGIFDDLEYDLAYRFFPNLLLQWKVPDLDQAYPYLGLAIPYGVYTYGNGAYPFCTGENRCLEIRYGIAYKYDCGDYKPGESTNYCDVSTSELNKAHRGDSEFYVALVRTVGPWSSAQYDARRWELIRDFTAAHWREGSAESSRYAAYGYCAPDCHTWDSSETQCRANSSQCSWFSGSCSGYDRFYQQCSGWDQESCVSHGGSCRWIPTSCSPRTDIMTCYSALPKTGPVTVYAAEGKHALYHTDGECDGGGFWSADNCPRNQYNLRNWISGKLQNIGNPGRPSSDTYIQHPNFCEPPYDVWGDDGFAASTPYSEHFSYPFSWGLPHEASPDLPPVASFSWQCTGLDCTFYSSSSDDRGISAWSWGFGEGTTRSGSVVYHTFPFEGTFTVSLTVTDTAGQTDQRARPVAVHEITCGDALCESGESSIDCPYDCGTCGNFYCDPGEDSFSCPDDCGDGSICGNFVCEPGEDPFNCSSDCCVPGECQ